MDERNYGSLPACKKLAEVLAIKGRKIETEAVWVQLPNGSYILTSREYYIKGDIPAYSMPEVWRELRKYIPDFQMYGRLWNALREKLFIDALIELWIWALEQEEASHD